MSRKQEAEVAKRRWHDAVTSNVLSINDTLQLDAKFINTLKQLRDLSDQKYPAGVQSIVEAIRAQEESSNKLIASGKASVECHRENMGISHPASQYKMRGQWMASLVSSGALPGWGARIFNSSEGIGLELSKIDQPISGLEDPDGQSMTETDLANRFEKNILLPIRSYGWCTEHDQYPGLFQPRMKYGPLIIGGSCAIPVPHSAITHQVTVAQRTESAKGGLSSGVASAKTFADGRSEWKIFDDAIEGSKENAEVYASMKEWNYNFELESKKACIELLERFLEEHKSDNQID